MWTVSLSSGCLRGLTVHRNVGDDGIYWHGDSRWKRGGTQQGIVSPSTASYVIHSHPNTISLPLLPEMSGQGVFEAAERDGHHDDA